MKIATKTTDGGVIVTSLVPSAVLIGDKRTRVVRTVDQGLILEDGQVVTLPVDILDAQTDSVDGATLLFPNMYDIVSKWTPEQQERVVSHRILEEVADLTDRTFRNAWEDADGKLSVNMPKARDLHREKLIRRNVTVDASIEAAIESASSPEELKAVASETANGGTRPKAPGLS